MKNAITALVVLIVIGVAGYFLLVRNDVTPTPSDNLSEDREVKGTVTNVDASSVPVDGPTYITVKADDGSETVVAVPSMGRNLCAAQANLTLTETLKVGDRVEVRGSAGADDMVIPCESEDHYIRLEQPGAGAKLNIDAVCEGALAYMTFPDGEAAAKFVADCKAGNRPEVIEKYREDNNLGDGAAI
jgi:hypothetical protein